MKHFIIFSKYIIIIMAIITLTIIMNDSFAEDKTICEAPPSYASGFINTNYISGSGNSDYNKYIETKYKLHKNNIKGNCIFALNCNSYIQSQEGNQKTLVEDQLVKNQFADIPIDYHIHEMVCNTELKPLDNTINIYGQIIENCKSTKPLSNITIEVENTGLRCTTDIDGNFMLKNVPIKKQKLNLYGANSDYITSMELIFNIDDSDICFNNSNQMIVDIENGDGKIFSNIQICLKLNLDDKNIYCDNTICGFELVSLDKTINLFGQIVAEGEDAYPLSDITIEVENTNISCTSGVDGGFMLKNVPIKKQKLNFYDKNNEYISSVELLFNIDGGDICLKNLEQMIVDVGNSDGKIFINLQICFEINLDNNTIYYDRDKIHGDMESTKNRIIYAIICVSFVIVFLSAAILHGRKKA